MYLKCKGNTMSKIVVFFKSRAKSLIDAFRRFSASIVFFLLSTILASYLIQTENTTEIMHTRLFIVFYLSSLFAFFIQLFYERFTSFFKKKIIPYVCIALFALALFFLLLGITKFTSPIFLRVSLFGFALLCLTLWIPSLRGGSNFNYIAFVFFKAFFIAIIYTLVVWAGSALILFAIDLLLVEIDYEAYLHLMNIVWNFLAPLIFFSYIPIFNKDQDSTEIKTIQSSRFFEVLISFIFIPLILIYIAVLYSYLLKILFLFSWPSGHLGPLVLGLSIASILVYILSKVIDTKITRLFQKILPPALIPLVLVQIFSISIRLKAYGLTVNRYYILLFALFTLISATLLLVKKLKHDNFIAFLAACFAIISLIPPIDAHGVSKRSQIKRLETYLIHEEMLENNQIKANKNANEEAKKEIREIIRYLDDQKYLEELAYIPYGFKPHTDMEELFGFRLYASSDNHISTTFVNVASKPPVRLESYDYLIDFSSSSRKDNSLDRYTVQKKDKSYQIEIYRESKKNHYVRIRDEDQLLLSANLGDIFDDLLDSDNTLRDEYLRLEIKEETCSLLVLFSYLSMSAYRDKPEDGDYTIKGFLLFQLEE